MAAPSQRFKQIKSHHLKNRTLFEDPEFPADSKSIDPANPQKYDKYGIEWLRPVEMFEHPAMFVDEASQLDICQGMLGDCWLLASIASLTHDKEHLNMVVPPDQGFERGQYCGAFRFCFWQFGQWTEVIIDDRLPTYNGKLIFVHSADHGEMWSALLEKAYAKLFKSYESLKGGQIGEALVDFTGGIAEDIKLDKAPPNLFKRVQKAHKRNYLMGCSVDSTGIVEEKMDNGLVKGHAYSVTGVAVVNGNSLIRVRNPWGNEREWTGPWSDESSEWNDVSASQKEELGVTYDHDGEFWMHFDDFTREFNRLTICHKASFDSESNTHFNVSENEASWVKKVTAGGCRNFPDTFGTNPQFRVVLTDTDDDDDDVCTLTVSLMQKNSRGFASSALTIGFMMYPIADDVNKYLEDGNRLVKEYFLYHKSCGRSASFVNSREVVQTFTLPPGEYVVVPSTYKPEEEGDFFIRLLTETSGNQSGELKNKIEMDAHMESYTDYDNEDPQMTSQLRPTFDQLAGEDRFINVTELLTLLEFISADVSEEKPDTSHAYALMALFDKDNSGKLDFHEFMKLYRYFVTCSEVFKKYSQGGKASPLDLDKALNEMHVKIPRKILGVAVNRYGDEESNISFSDFMAIVSKVKTIISTCQEDSSGMPSSVLEKLLMATLIM